MLTKAQIDQLREAFVAGETQAAAERLTKTSHKTVFLYFRRFADAGIVRGRVKRKSPHHRCDPALPRYGGPDWIGKRIDAGTR